MIYKALFCTYSHEILHFIYLQKYKFFAPGEISFFNLNFSLVVKFFSLTQ